MGHLQNQPQSAAGPHLRAATAVAACVLLLSGCQSMGRDEMTWQMLHAMDVAQTLNAASDPCYKEDAWLTKRLIGEQPSDSEVLAWGVGTAGSAAVWKTAAPRAGYRNSGSWAPWATPRMLSAAITRQECVRSAATAR